MTLKRDRILVPSYESVLPFLLSLIQHVLLAIIYHDQAKDKSVC